MPTKTSGWSGAIYGARRSLPSALPSDGWVKLADVNDAARRERVALPGRESMRYYLVWITALHIAVGHRGEPSWPRR